MTRGVREHWLCTVDDCGRKHYARGVCARHYQRLRNHGSLADPRPTPEDLFWAKVDKSGDCWLWTGATDSHGYGAFTVQRRMHGAHRWLFEQTHGAIERDLMIDHMCHNLDPACPGGKTCTHRRCVNLNHLVLATNQENQERARARRLLATLDNNDRKKIQP